MDDWDKIFLLEDEFRVELVRRALLKRHRNLVQSSSIMQAQGISLSLDPVIVMFRPLLLVHTIQANDELGMAIPPADAGIRRF